MFQIIAIIPKRDCLWFFLSLSLHVRCARLHSHTFVRLFARIGQHFGLHASQHIKRNDLVER